MSVDSEDITAHQQAEEKIQLQNVVLRAINQILEAALRTTTEEELGRACLAVAEEITGSKFGFIGEIGADGLLHATAISDPSWDVCQMTDTTSERRPPGDFPICGIHGRVLLDGKGFFANDPSSHPDRIGTPPGHPPLTAFLGVPLLREGQPIGMIAVGNRESGYDETHLEALEALAPIIFEAFLRKRAEQEAEESKRILEALMDSVPEGITIASAPDVTIGLVSRHGQELLGGAHDGLTAGQVTEQWKVYHADGVTPLADADLPLVRAIQHGETVRDVELIQVSAAGKRLLLSCNAGPIRDREGSITGGVVAWRDITETREAERRAQEELHRNREWLRVTLTSIGDGVIATDIEGRITFINPVAAALTGWPEEAAVGQPVQAVFRIVDERSGQPAEDIVGQVLQERRAVEMGNSTALISRDGRQIPIEDSAAPILTEGDGLAGAVLVFHDVTEKRRALEALRESEERFRTIYDTAPVSIWQEDWTDVIRGIDRLRVEGVTDWARYFADHPGFVTEMLDAVKILDVNQWTVDMFEARHKAEMLASLGTVFATEDTLPGFVAELTALANGQRVFRTEMTVNTVRGDIRHILLAMSFPPCGSHSGQVLVSTIDITERKQAEEALREAQQFSAALNRINETLHASLDTGEIMERLVSEGAAALGCDTAAVSLREGDHWAVRHIYGMPESLIDAQMDDDEECHAVLALNTRQVVVVADAVRDERVNQAHLRRHNVRAVLVAPLIVRDEPFGVIFFNYRSAPQIFREAQVAFVAQLAATASIALENGRLFEERKQVEEALWESDQRFRSVLENSLDAAYRRNLQSDRYDYMSPVFERITAWSVEEMNAADINTILGRIHPDDLPQVKSQVDRTLAVCQAGETATASLEYRFLGKDGAYHWLGDHINVLPDSAGQPLYRLGIVRDISERKRRDEELRRLNRTLRAHSHSDQALLRATTEAEYMQEVCRIIVEDCGHAMVWIGFAEEDEAKTVRPVAYAGFEEGYLETLHITWADTARGRGPTGMAVRTGKPSFCRNMLTDPQFEPWRAEALRRGYASSLVLPLLDDGQAFGALTIYFREPDPFTEDEIALLSGLADDLAYGIRTLRLREARAKAEEALQRAHDELEVRVQERTAELQASEERFRQLAENIQEVFWMLEPGTWRILYVSPAYDAIWGRSRQALYEQPRSVLETIHPDDRQQVVEGFTRGGETYDGEFRVLRPDGGERWIRIRAFPVYNEAGQVYRLAGIATDRTEQKATEAALIQAERLTIVGKLAASLTHEIGNPLQAVIGCLDLAQEALDQEEDPSKFLDVGRQEAQRTARIVSQLRSLGRPIQRVSKEPTDLNRLLDDVLALNRKQFQTNQIEVIWEPDADLPPVEAMADSLRQVFLNLVLNAIEAMPQGGQLQVSTTRTDSPEGVHVAVTDTGAGIPPEVLPHIFEAFYSTKSEGMGVGLFVCHNIVQQHGGRIVLDSQPGAGTTFGVWLPE